MKPILLRLPSVALVTLLAGCVSVSRTPGAEHIQSMVGMRVPNAQVWQQQNATTELETRVGEIVAAPLTPESARQIALLKNPGIAAAYARIGIAQADVVDASKIANPGFSGSALKNGGASRITTGLSVQLADLLLLPSRRRLAAGEYEHAQQLIAAELVKLVRDVNQAWYEAAGAQQVAAMRGAVSKAATASAELARRYYEAGNVSALEFKLEQASASQARFAAATAKAESSRARLELNTRMGLSGAIASRWKLDVPMAAPVSEEDGLETLQSVARQHRLDLLAARQHVDQLDHVVGMVKRWRLIGNLDIGIEREREPEGSRLTGPTLSLAIPLFNQGQGAIARAEAQLEVARSDLAHLDLQIDNDVRLGHERVAALRGIAEDYRMALIPQREAVVGHQADRNNFMLIGAFELLFSRQQEFDAYAGYLDAVRDYWLARNDLARAIGTSLPSDASIAARVIDVDSLLAPPADPGMGHMNHGTSTEDPADNEHQGHDMSTMEPVPAGDAHSKGGSMSGMDHSAHETASAVPREKPPAQDTAAAHDAEHHDTTPKSHDEGGTHR